MSDNKHDATYYNGHDPGDSLAGVQYGGPVRDRTMETVAAWGSSPVIPAPVQKRRVWPWILTGIAALMILLCVGGSILVAGSSGNQTGPAAAETGSQKVQAPAPKPKADPTLGQAVSGSGWEFTANAIKCGIRRVGNGYAGVSAQGSFCRLDITVKNIGSSGDYFTSGMVKMVASNGDEFSADDEAAIYGNKDASGWIEQINPGNKVRAFLFFDLPSGAKATSIKLESGLFTSEKVKL